MDFFFAMKNGHGNGVGHNKEAAKNEGENDPKEKFFAEVGYFEKVGGNLLVFSIALDVKNE